jgi:hypothetical protein
MNLVYKIKLLLIRIIRKHWHILLAAGVGLLDVKMMTMFGLLG